MNWRRERDQEEPWMLKIPTTPLYLFTFHTCRQALCSDAMCGCGNGPMHSTSKGTLYSCNTCNSQVQDASDNFCLGQNIPWIVRESSCGGDSITNIALANNLAISLPCLILVLSDTTMTFGFLCFVTVSTSHRTKLQPDVKRGFVDTPSGGCACLARGPQRGSPELVAPAAALSAPSHQAEPAA